VGASFAEVADAYAGERPRYQELVDWLVPRLRAALADSRIDAEVTGRAKETLSFVKKALRKGYPDPLRDIGDKAGIRIAASHLPDIRRIEGVVQRFCGVDGREEKRDALDYDQLGYLGVHLDVRIRSDVLDEAHTRLADLRAEVQLHTRAQSAWAVVSHDLLYKTAVELPKDVKRGVMRLVALTELFDAEVARFRQGLEDHPDFGEMLVLSKLDNLIVRFTNRRPDPAFSALSVPTLARLYNCPPEQIVERAIQPFIQSAHAQLEAIYTNYRGDDRANPLLFQPEALLIFERLEHDRDRLAERWPDDALPRELLDSMAAIWGVDLG
jgi:ppGpp synthetase/RelA/SpoT-type nucleotidyltranferase